MSQQALDFLDKRSASRRASEGTAPKKFYEILQFKSYVGV